MRIEYFSRISYLELMIQGHDLRGRGDEIHQLQVILDNEKQCRQGYAEGWNILVVPGSFFSFKL